MSTKGLEKCIYAYYGLGYLRCSRAGNEGNICNEKCEDFEYTNLEVD